MLNYPVSYEVIKLKKNQPLNHFYSPFMSFNHYLTLNTATVSYCYKLLLNEDFHESLC